MDFVVPNEVVYDFDGRASVSEVAKSLLAQDRLLREALLVVERLYPDLDLAKIDVAVRHVTHESPFRSTLFAYVFGLYSQALGEDMPDVLETLTGGAINVSDGADSFVNIIVLFIAVYFADKIRAKLFPSEDEQVIAAEKRRLLAASASAAGVSENAMQRAVDHVANKRPGILGKAVTDFLAPAKRHHARALRSGNEEIGEDAIKAFPSDADMAAFEPPSQIDELEKVVVKFQAHDLTRPKKWAAVVEEAADNRLPLHLAPHIAPEQLFEAKDVLADVVVTSNRNDEGDYIPAFYILTKVYDENPS